MNNKPLFNEDFEAWAYGTVNPKIYNLYKIYGYNSIDYPNKLPAKIDKDTIEFLYDIWNTYGIYDRKYLENLTHYEIP